MEQQKEVSELLPMKQRVMWFGIYAVTVMILVGAMILQSPYLQTMPK